jgi:signal transduction histidine kinase
MRAGTCCIISNDSQLIQTSREVFTELFHSEWTLEINPDADPAAYDLCVLDLPLAADRLQDQLSRVNPLKCFFVFDKEYLAEFSPELARAPFILLRPVRPASLRAFLEEYGARSADVRCGADDIAGLARQRDDILQSLIQANLKLQEYDQERTGFVARAVHDFRVPLTAIQGYCGLLLAERLGPITGEQREVLERMQRSARRLSRAVTGMFELTVRQRISSAPQFEPGDLRESIEQALHETALAAREKSIAVFVDMVPCNGELRLDRSQIDQVLMNLLDNAIRYTPRHGTIHVSGYPDFWERRVPFRAPHAEGERRRTSSREPNCFRLDVRDNGPGIPPEHLRSLFEEHASYSGGQNRSGSGLGLAISKMILEWHHGRIWVSSGDSGATFSFVLPFQQASACELPLSPENTGVAAGGAN